MVLVDSYSVAVFCFILTMICWGSWSNTQKLAQRSWRFELFYWDFVVGLVIFALLSGLTLGSYGQHGKEFISDITQANWSNIGYALLGGVVWNIGNILLVAAIAIAGMSVAFPIGGGLAWLGGIVFNFILEANAGNIQSQPFILFFGVLIALGAIYLSALSYRKISDYQHKPSLGGILLSVGAGLFIAFFYGLVVKSIDAPFLDTQYSLGALPLEAGKLGPYSAVFFFTVGAFLSTFIINPVFMKYPVEGKPVKISAYFKGGLKTHLFGVLGGFIWALGMVASFMAVRNGGPAVSYALSNAAPLVAILWGVLAWKEFKNAPKGTNYLLGWMFSLFVIGLIIVTYSKVA
jgi:glucose uptake protein